MKTNSSTKAKAKTKAKGKEGTLPSKPKRPLSAFNLFYRHKRQRVLDSIAAGGEATKEVVTSLIEAPAGLENVPASDTVSLSPEAVNELRRANILRDMADCIHARENIERPQRTGAGALKGAVGFVELGRMMTAAWKDCDEVAKSTFGDLAAEGRSQYLEKMQEYTKKERKRKAEESIELSRKRALERKDGGGAAAAAGRKPNNDDDSNSEQSEEDETMRQAVPAVGKRGEMGTNYLPPNGTNNDVSNGNLQQLAIPSNVLSMNNGNLQQLAIPSNVLSNPTGIHYRYPPPANEQPSEPGSHLRSRVRELESQLAMERLRLRVQALEGELARSNLVEQQLRAELVLSQSQAAQLSMIAGAANVASASSATATLGATANVQLQELLRTYMNAANANAVGAAPGASEQGVPPGSVLAHILEASQLSHAVSSSRTAADSEARSPQPRHENKGSAGDGG